MDTKKYIYIGIFIGSTAGGWVGSLLDNGNFFGFWGFFLGTVGAFVGLWAGFKLGSE